jgi:tetratricopeptide (TPR) repeat protein
VTADPESTLRPLRERAADREALRRGAASAAQVVRIARAAETTLRRMLRDDPTAPVELRLRALSADDLPTPELLAELRRRDRIPMDVAAAFHDLDLAAERIAGGTEALERDRELALAVADGVEAHVLSRTDPMPLRDPVVPEPPGSDDDERGVHPVPASRRGVPWGTLAALAAIVVLLLLAIRLRGGDDVLRQGETAYREGRVVEAERLFRRAADEDGAAALPRVYLARIYRESGRSDAARREVEAGLRAAPSSAGLHVERGYLLLDTGQASEAVPVFREALRHDRDSDRAWAGLVRALRESGRPADAEQVLRLAPPDLRALMRTADERRAP